MKLSRRHLAIGTAAAATAGLAAWWMLGRARGPRDLPDVAYTLLDGSTHRTAQLRGRVVFVNFWATTCSVCVREMPQIIATHERFAPQGLTTLSVAMQYDPPAAVDDYAKSRHLPFGVAIDNTGAIARAFGDVRATPTSFVIDKTGRVAEFILGEPDFPSLHARLQRLLAA